MPTPLTWTTLEVELLVLLAQAPPPYNVVPPDFASLYPNATSYAETRITQEIPLLADRTADTSLTTGTSRSLNLAAMTRVVVVPEQLSLITPAGAAAASGARVPYDKADKAVIDMIWPNEATVVAPSIADWSPRLWALLDNSTMIIAPTPGAGYAAEITGLFVPTPLSAGNPATYLSTNYPDLLVAGCMVWLEGGLKRNFGAQADDPRQALSWEGTYQTLKRACEFEEMRRRGLAPNVPAMTAASAPGAR